MSNLMQATRAGIISNWICSSLTLLVLLIRLASDKLTRSWGSIATYATVLSILVLLARASCDDVYLDFGTVNNVLNEAHPHPVSAAEHGRLKTGSILALVCRALVTTFYWLQCGVLLLLYQRVLGHISWVGKAIRGCWTLMALAYVAVILITFLECHPFHLYYQLHPNPGQCILAYGQLLAQGIANITIDLSLLIISFPILRTRTTGTSATIRLCTIYLLGTFAIIVSCVRIAMTYDDHSDQISRSVWASIQALTAALVANLSTIYGNVVILRRQRQASNSGAIPLQRDYYAVIIPTKNVGERASHGVWDGDISHVERCEPSI